MSRKTSVLVTGGAGYIGSHVVLALREAGYPVVVLDDLSTGYRVEAFADVPFVEGDVGSVDAVGRVIAEHRVGAAIHLAGSISVPESIGDPLLYWRNNAGASANLVSACLARGVRWFVFSSTAAVYGIPRTVPVSEDALTAPISPYGRSKLAVEWMLRDTAAVHDFCYAALRYFNVAGADPDGRTGQRKGSRHLIKAACEAALGMRDRLVVFGTDYETADGTCVRDYIHVSDLARAHVAALRHLEGGGGSLVLNCGYGREVSVREAVEAVRVASNSPFEVQDRPRRAGDPPVLVADARRIREMLNWTPRHDDLGVIVRTALAWERARCPAS